MLNRNVLMTGAVVILGGFIFMETASAVDVIDDHFDDGVLGTNTLGVGNGFTAVLDGTAAQTASITITESGTLVDAIGTSTGSGDFNAVARRSINSNDSFQFFNAAGATAQFDIAGVTVAAADGGPPPNQFDFTRAYIGLMDAAATIGGPASGNAASNVSVRLFGEGVGANDIGAATTEGALVLEQGGAVEVISSWNWASFDGSGPLSVVMNVDENGYNITFSDGTAAQIGTWAATASNFNAADWAGGAVAYAHSQIFIEGTDNGSGLGILSVDRVRVTEIPEPASLALLGLGGLMMLRRRHA